MKIPCSKCNQRLEIPEELAGQTIECPACNTSLAVPSLAAPPSVTPQVKVATPQVASTKKPKSSISKWAIASVAGIAVVVVVSIMFFPEMVVKTPKELPDSANPWIRKTVTGQGTHRASSPAEANSVEPVPEVAAQKIQIAKDIIWGKSGKGIAIEKNGKTMVRRSNSEKPWSGSISKHPMPVEKLVAIKIESSSGKFYSYIGVLQKDVDLNDYRRSRGIDNSWCLYFADNTGRSGVHDSEYSRRNNKSDWRGGAASYDSKPGLYPYPSLHNSDIISILYSPKKETVTFFKDDKTIYIGKGYSGELYLYSSVRYPGESITIVE